MRINELVKEKKKKSSRKSKTNHLGRKLTWTVCNCGDWITDGCGVWNTPWTCTVWPEGNCTRVTAGEPLPVPDPATETCKNDHHWGLRLDLFLVLYVFLKEIPFTIMTGLFFLLLRNDKQAGVCTIRRWLLSWNSHSLMWQILKNPCSSLSVPMLWWLRMFQAQSSKAVKLPHCDLTTANSEAFFRPEYKLPSLTS